MPYLALVFALALAIVAGDALAGRHALAADGRALTRRQALAALAWAVALAVYAVPAVVARAEDRAAATRDALAAVAAAQTAEAEFKASVAGLSVAQLRAAANRFEAVGNAAAALKLREWANERESANREAR